jgi:hypothetical protein
MLIMAPFFHAHSSGAADQEIRFGHFDAMAQPGLDGVAGDLNAGMVDVLGRAILPRRKPKDCLALAIL